MSNWWDKYELVKPAENTKGNNWWDNYELVQEPPKKQADKTNDSLETAKNWGSMVRLGFEKGISKAESGLGNFIQAPTASTLSFVKSANAALDSGMTDLINVFSPGEAVLYEPAQKEAEMAAAFAEESRNENVNSKYNVAAKAGKWIQDNARENLKEIEKIKQERNPELIRQQEEISKAQGFVDKSIAILKNPLGAVSPLVESAPDMLFGLGVGRLAAGRVMATEVAVAESAAARVAAAGGDAVAQQAAAKTAMEAVRQKAVQKASTAGVLSEGASSANSSRESAYGEVASMPFDKLVESPRFVELVKETGDQNKAREILANEIADRTPILSAATTIAGSLATNKLFGGDATAKVLAGIDKASIKAVIKDASQEGVEEVLQGVPQGFSDHKAMQIADPNKKFDLGGEIAQNALGGILMGGGGHGGAYAYQKAGDLKSIIDAKRATGEEAPNSQSDVTNTRIEKPSDAEAALMKPKNISALDRVGEIDNDLVVAQQRFSSLTPENGYGPTFDDERQELQESIQQLQQERDQITQAWPKSIEGAETKFSTEAGVHLGAKYALMEASDIQTSHDENLRANPAYPPDLQPRERDRAASSAQISGIVSKMDPARLGLSADAATGAPIVGADGLVESGNARTIALKRVFRANGQKAEDYKNFITQNAAQFGIDPLAVGSMTQPVLVRVRTTPVNRAEFARQANASTVARMSPVEQARSDAARLDVLDDLNPDENGDFTTSRDFVRRFMAKVPQTEVGEMMDSDGRLSPAGYARMRNAVLAKAYGDSPVILRMTDSLDDNLRNVSKALMQVAPQIAKVRSGINEGYLHDADITPDLMGAVEELSRIKEQGGTVKDYLSQSGMFEDKLTPDGADMLRFLDENIRRPRQMAEFILRYTQALEAMGNPGQASMFDDDFKPTKSDLLTAARREQDGTQEPASREGEPKESEVPSGQNDSKRIDASRNEEGNQGNVEDTGGQTEQLDEPKVVDGWAGFAANSGTLRIPRAEMPQIKAEHRGAMVNFLKARDIASTQEEVDANSLKPTQAEYSPDKVQKAKDYDGGDRSILVSSDNHILDGHHQWLAKKEMGDDVKVIRLDAPIDKLLETVKEFPSAETSQESNQESDQKSAPEDSLVILEKIAEGITATRMIKEESVPELVPALQKVFEQVIQETGKDSAEAIKSVKAKLKSDAKTKKITNLIKSEMYQKAAKNAIEALDNTTIPKAAAETNILGSDIDVDAQSNEGVSSPDPDAVFKGEPVQHSYSIGMPTDMLREKVESITGDWENTPKVNYVEFTNELPFEAPSNVRGAFYRGQVYLVASNIQNESEAQMVLFHEVLGHAGLRGLFGNQLNGALVTLAQRNKHLFEAAKTWRRANADIRGKRTDTQWFAVSVEESLSEIAESGKKITGLQKFMSKVQELLRAINLHAVADWFESRSDAEVMNLLSRARSFIVDGNEPQIFGQQEAQAYSLSSSDETPVMSLKAQPSPVSKNPAKTPLYEAFRQLARFDGTFQMATSKSADLATIASEMNSKDPDRLPKFSVEKSSAMHQGKRKDTLALKVEGKDGVSHSLLNIFDANTSHPFVVIGNENLGSRVGGANAYQIAFAWAHNNGKVMRPDPQGLTVINRLRRSEAMISSAYHYGTTKHLEPHQDQYVALTEMAKKQGAEPEDTSKYGNPELFLQLEEIKKKLWLPETQNEHTSENLQHLIEASSALAILREPSITLLDVRGGSIYQSGMDDAVSISDMDSETKNGERAFRDIARRAASTGVGKRTGLRAAVTQAIWASMAAKTVAKQTDGNQRPELDAIKSIHEVLGDIHGASDNGLSGALYNRALNKSAAERAEDIIQKHAATPAPIDKAVRVATQLVGLDKLTTAIYSGASFILDRYTPETLKAGFVSDYGVPEAVIDRRATLSGHMNVQTRKAGKLIDKLSTLTREESRMAYEWMNNSNPDALKYFEDQLPEESVKVLAEVKEMIDSLSKESVALGQLSHDAYEQNKMEYLRRSYAKHTLDLDEKEKKSGRPRSISILGDQYKGRGLAESAPMKKMQNIAPDWWGRKLKEGKADVQLKGEMFVRLEKHAHSGEGTMPLEGIGDRSKGRLQEVVYYPAGEPIPRQYAEWEHAGTYEVRDTKGENVVLWRDFTKAEREQMGEIDEARFAIAKTLHGMIHDVEVGRYMEWLNKKYGLTHASQVPGDLIEAKELGLSSMHTVYKKGDWVQVPETKIAGTDTHKYGKLAGKYIPGPIWNDLRQINSGSFKPIGDVYASILKAWKMSKTALSPAVHMNNVMANMVMADWHDVTAGHIAKSLRILMAASDRDGTGLIGTAQNAASRAGIADREAAKEIVNRYQDSGGNIGTWASAELQNEQIQPLLDALEAEAASDPNSSASQVGIMNALQLVLAGRYADSGTALVGSKPVKAVKKEAQNMIDLYQAEDEVFRLAAWLKAKEDGETDMQAGHKSRKSFLDYNINAPWMAGLRATALPFAAFSYRAIPMMAETVAKKPWKIMKLAMLGGMLNALGYMLSGGDEDDERRYLPEEKAGRVWGMVPKLVRMPWNDSNDQPVFLDVRRFIPVGDVFDIGQNHSAIPLPPSVMPGGPMALMAEVFLNKSMFTGQSITEETDTNMEKVGKTIDYLYKAMAPNLPILPGTHSFDGIAKASSGATDAFGRELSLPQAALSSVGIKLGSYPGDVLRMNAAKKLNAQLSELEANISKISREQSRGGMTYEEYMEKVQKQRDKIEKLSNDFMNK